MGVVQKPGQALVVSENTRPVRKYLEPSLGCRYSSKRKLVLEFPLYRTVICHLLIVAIALQSLLAFGVAHPLHDQEAHHHHEVAQVSNASAPQADVFLPDHLHLEHCCHFHLGCGVFAAGNLLTFALRQESVFWPNNQVFVSSAPAGSPFRPPIV